MARKVLFNCPTSTLEEFRAFAGKAAALGATHVYISDLPKSRWLWDFDRNDPYPNWGMLMATIFKVVIPPELADFLPAGYCRKNLEIVRQRSAILEKLGLKAAFLGKEPAYLPESVFQAHPDWRGPRCEHPRRSRHTYYAPCIDRPEVLSMYRRAVAELCRAAPIELFSFLTNDSGSGICWSVSLYPGQNGPAWCRERAYAGRVVGFLSTIQEGARDAGLEAEVSFHYGSGTISEAEIASVIPYLRPGQAINGKTSDGLAPVTTVGTNFYDCWTNPVLGVPQVFRVAEQLQAAAQDERANLSVVFSQPDSPELFALLRQFRKKPFRGFTDRMEAVRSAAAELAGEENAEAFVGVWEKIDRAVGTVRSMGVDPLMLVGTINQRWITRPLVPFPMELKPEEKDYYRKFQFQANTEEEAADLMNLQGFEVINGFSGSLLAGNLFNQAVDHLESALRDIAGLKEKVGDRGGLDRLGWRLKALICFYRNARHTIQYQDILDRTDYEHPPVEENIYPMDGDQKLREIQIVTRNEIDNINELVDLFEKSPFPLVELAPSKEEEDIFLIGPDIVEQLRKKVRIMLRHERDVDRLYKRRQG
ncbi:MAG: hypothetical protein JXE07_02575 [Candidatus Aminicenantes bacterium]|nr:hypothetical protein [Candidatus Aminicenantes bacterium]